MSETNRNDLALQGASEAAFASDVAEHNRILIALSQRIGKKNAIGMVDLHRAVFASEIQDKINDTRKLRKHITVLRNQGVPICALSDPTRGGYYLPSSPDELLSYCQALRSQALRPLAIEAKLRRMPLARLLGQMALESPQADEAGAPDESTDETTAEGEGEA